MLVQVPADVEPLLHDNAWFARITRALVSGDGERHVDSPSIPLQPVLGPSPDEALALMEMRLDLLDAVLALAEPWRGTVAPRLLEGWPLQRISAVTHASEAIVRRRVRRGLEWIRIWLRSTDGKGR